MIVPRVFYVDSSSVAATIDKIYLISFCFLPRENLGLGLGKIDSLPWRTPGTSLSLVNEHHGIIGLVAVL